VNDLHNALPGLVEEGAGPLYQSHVFLNESEVLYFQLLEDLLGDLEFPGGLVAEGDEVVLIDVGDMAGAGGYWRGVDGLIGWLGEGGTILGFVLLAH
jgi:hypothetical protein